MSSGIERFGLMLQTGRDSDVVDPENDPRYRNYVTDFHGLVGRNSVTPDTATIVRTNRKVIGALAVRRGEADALIGCLQGLFIMHARDIQSAIGLSDTAGQLSALPILVMSRGVFLLAESYVHIDPSAAEIVESTLQARGHASGSTREPKRRGCYSNCGSRDDETSEKVRKVYEKLKQVAPNLVLEGKYRATWRSMRACASAMCPVLCSMAKPICLLSRTWNRQTFP